MTQSFYWRRTTATWFLAAYSAILLILAISAFVVVAFLENGEMFPDLAGLVALNCLVICGYLGPRFFGLMKNRMRIIVDAQGIVMPSGRRVPRQVIAGMEAWNPASPPVWISIKRWPVPVRVFVSCYEDPGGLVHAINGLRGGMS